MRKDTPLVSIIVPVYNVEPYVEECLESLVNQTYKNLEIILVDDGSTDNSGKICDEYGNRFNQIKVIHKQNEGLGMARNTGLDHASGDFVYFFDSDDYIELDELEYLINKAVENEVDVCLTGFKSVNDSKQVLVVREYEDRVYRGKTAKTELFPKMLGSLPDGEDRIEMSASAQLYAMRPITEHGIRFVSERNLISEDLVFNMDYMQYANGACTVKRIGNYYRNNPNSLSHQYRSNRIEKTIFFYEYILKRLTDLKFVEKDIDRHKKQFFIGLRACIAQERKNSSDSLAVKIKRISRLCNQLCVKQAIESYPIADLGIKQRLFLFFLKNQMSLVLYFAS